LTQRVLLVDDDASVRGYLRVTIMLEEGFEIVAEGTDGRQGVLLAEQHQPDVVVLDYRMPHINGLQALPLIRQAAPGSQVIMLSGDPEEEMRDRALAAGALAFVPKGRSDRFLEHLRTLAAPVAEAG
jgi:two-component system, chemotaxis family, chemotaxis protein CheY